MSSCYLIVFLMKVESSLTLDQVRDHLLINMIIYRQLVGKLIYLACGTRPDIAFVIRQHSRYNSDPRAVHIRIPKQTLQYLKRTSFIGIISRKDPASHQDNQTYNSLGLVSYTNNNYTGDIDDRKSITEYCFFFAKAITTWFNKRLQTMLTSISEVKYVAMSHGVREKVWV